MTDYAKFFDGILNERQVKLNEPMSRHTTYGIGGYRRINRSPEKGA